jgi:hypothetical protein
MDRNQRAKQQSLMDSTGRGTAADRKPVQDEWITAVVVAAGSIPDPLAPLFFRY